jgi:hypothetical protein
LLIDAKSTADLSIGIAVLEGRGLGATDVIREGHRHRPRPRNDADAVVMSTAAAERLLPANAG